MTEAEFGWLSTIFLWVYGGFSPVAGFLADRFNRSRVIVGSLFVWSVVTWLTGYATSYQQLLIARALMGISEACYIPAALALIADYHRGGTRSLATGIHMSGINVGASLGGLGGVLAKTHDWSFPFQLFGIAGVIYSLLLATILRDPPCRGQPDDSNSEVQSVRFFSACISLFHSKQFILLLIVWSLLGFTGWLMNAWMPSYLQEQFHLGQGEAGMSATGYLYSAAFFGVLIGGAWADYLNRKLPRGRIIVPIIGLCMAAPGVLLAASSSLFPLAIVGLVVYGLTRPFTDANLMPILCMIADKRYRATGYGILNAFSCLVGGIGPVLGGKLRDAGLNVALIFQFSAGCILLSAVLLVFVNPSTPQRKSLPS